MARLPLLALVTSVGFGVPLAALGCSSPPPPAPRSAPASAASPALPVSAPPSSDAGAPPVELVMSPADCTKEPAGAVSRADALVDLTAVERVITGGWAGYETMTKRGVDFGRRFAEGRAWIAKAAEPIGVEAFQAELVAILRPAADNHMAFFAFTPKGHARRKSVGHRERAFTADVVVVGDKPPLRIVDPGKPRHGAELVSCEGHPLESLLRPTPDTTGGALRPARRPILLAEKAPDALHCTIRLESKQTDDVWVPTRPLRQGAPVSAWTPAANGPAVSFKEGPLPILQLRTFWGAQATALEAFVATAPKLRSAKAIVVDVRGNSGGSSDYARRWFADLTAGTFAETVVDLLESDVTREGIFNANLCELEEGGLDPAGRKEVEDRLAHARLVLDTGQRANERFRRWRPARQSSVEGKAPSPFAGTLVVLTDNECASACESFLTMAASLPAPARVLVVGENTAGVGVFGENVVYRLPKSGLGMSAGMKHFHESDPSRDIVEGRGFAPDVWLDVGASEDPLPLAVRLAECLAKPAGGCGFAKARSGPP